MRDCSAACRKISSPPPTWTVTWAPSRVKAGEMSASRVRASPGPGLGHRARHAGDDQGLPAVVAAHGGGVASRPVREDLGHAVLPGQFPLQGAAFGGDRFAVHGALLGGDHQQHAGRAGVELLLQEGPGGHGFGAGGLEAAQDQAVHGAGGQDEAQYGEGHAGPDDEPGPRCGHPAPALEGRWADVGVEAVGRVCTGHGLLSGRRGGVGGKGPAAVHRPRASSQASMRSKVEAAERAMVA